MTFDSLTFLIFLAIVWSGYWALQRRVSAQNVFLISASYVFYGWMDSRFCILLGLCSLISFVVGLQIAHAAKVPRRKKMWLVGGSVLLIGILGVFKYCNFFIESVCSILTSLGFEAHLFALNILLPIGLSFYTFQSIGYLMDVSRGTIPPCRNALAFFSYMSFFPQLMAGPIARASEQLPQFLQPRHFSYDQGVDGCRQFLWGFFKKFAVADSCTGGISYTLSAVPDPKGIVVLAGLALYTIQIYCDFSGYSDMALGVGKLFGIRLPRNFAFPYFATNIADFWRRWHMSLMRWFKDYLYIPLGGSRVGKIKHIRNVFIVFLVSGLWHGAAWTFILWGLFHACCFLPRFFFQKKTESKTSALFSWALTMLAVMFGWLIFYAPNVATLEGWLSSFAHFGTLGDLMGIGVGMSIGAAPLVFIVEFFTRHKEHPGQGLHLPRPLRWFLYFALIALIIYYTPSSGGDFIYGQF